MILRRPRIANTTRTITTTTRRLMLDRRPVSTFCWVVNNNNSSIITKSPKLIPGGPPGNDLENELVVARPGWGPRVVPRPSPYRRRRRRIGIMGPTHNSMDENDPIDNQYYYDCYNENEL